MIRCRICRTRHSLREERTLPWTGRQNQARLASASKGIGFPERDPFEAHILHLYDHLDGPWIFDSTT